MLVCCLSLHPQPIDIIREDAIFTTDHAIELAELAKGYEMQYVAPMQPKRKN